MEIARLVLAAASALFAMIPLPASGWTEREVATGSGPSALHGTLTLPEGGSPAPGLLILVGSGPVDRDGNVPGAANDSVAMLARGLAERGIVALRIDKRGIGASRQAGPREEELRIDTYVADAVTWLGVLRAEPRVSRACLLGHSEGALIATLAARKTPVAGLVLVAGAGEPVGRIMERQLAAADVPDRLREAAHRIIAELGGGQPVSDVPAALAALFRPSVQPYLISWLVRDPVAELAQVDAPILIVQGTTDLQVSVDDARRLAAARSGTRLTLIDGMNHVLKPAPLDRSANFVTYADPTLPLAPELVPTIAAFLSH